MRIIRVRHNGRAFYASLNEDSVTCLHSHLGYTGPIDLRDVQLAPLVAPSKIICVGLNYRDHAAELDMPLRAEAPFFLKPPSSIIENGQSILLPERVGRVDFEGELAVVMGQSCYKISPKQAKDYVFGYTCANDVTARDLQKGEVMFGRCKGYDTFCPLGPWIETDLPPEDSYIRTKVNHVVQQSALLSEMIFSPLELVSHVSQVMTLLPGDVILTGTPSGVGPVEEGDIVVVEIENVGILTNSVERMGLPQAMPEGPLQ